MQMILADYSENLGLIIQINLVDYSDDGFDYYDTFWLHYSDTFWLIIQIVLG